MKKQISIVTIMATAFSLQSKGEINYPTAPQNGEKYECFGIIVNDNFRPLEDDTSAETAQWVTEENKLTEDYLSRIPFRESIRARLTALNNYNKYQLPYLENDGRYYFFHNDGLKNQAVLYRQASLESEPEVFLNPNTLSSDGTVALKAVTLSQNGQYTAFCISRNGSDWVEIFVLDTETKQLLPDHIEWSKFSNAEWSGNGFYYSAYERPKKGKEFSNANEYHKVYYHQIGTSQDEDILVYENSSQPLHFHYPFVSSDGSVLFILESGEGNGNALYVKNLNVKDSSFVCLENTQNYEMSPIDVIDGWIYFYTSKDARKYRLVKAPIDNPIEENWVTVVAEREDAVLTGVSFAGKSHIILTYDKDASNQVFIAALNGSVIKKIDLPTFGSVGISGSRKSETAFYSFESFTYPKSIYTLDLNTAKSNLFRETKVDGLNPEDYITEQVFYTSSDGTHIPMFITYKKGIIRNSSNPTYLYGYGGFNITLNPSFSTNRTIWLENGGIYAQANLRGGGEYGEEWHIAGTKMQKLNVFNDFISAGEYLINEGYTDKKHLVIEGGSYGGLLVGACVNMRPDLFKVAIPRVGVMDMMRYHLFTIGWNWAFDYGTADDSKEMAEYLHNYSPIHNIKNDGTPYPAILVTTADHDDRVVPAHSFKYAATLQSSDTGTQPKLIRIDSNAGHGAGKPISKIIDEWTDIYSFIFNNLDICPKIE